MKNSGEIRWGILGCGDVCEVKSGPAFSKVPNSSLVAVMRRDEEKVRDFAKRHNVPKYYTNAQSLIDDPDINAIYIATPPAFHEEYAIECIRKQKPVYIEKPVTLTSQSCERILEATRKYNVKASIAHYRREMPMFKKIRQTVESGVIGNPSLVVANTLQAPSSKIGTPQYWRIDPKVSGGGLFFDLAPHQLDIFLWLFGAPKDVRDYSVNQTKLYDAPDLTNVEGLFGEVYVHALWAFNVGHEAQGERCEIIGNKGKIEFSFFSPTEIVITTVNGTERISIPPPVNIQEPMIDAVVRYFRNEGSNPCSLEEALVTMKVMESPSKA